MKEFGTTSRFKGDSLEEEVCNRLSLEQFFGVVIVSYLNHHLGRLEEAGLEFKRRKKRLGESSGGKKKEAGLALGRAKRKQAILEDKNGKLVRNLEVFSYRILECDDTFQEIGEVFNLPRQRAHQIFHEVRKVILNSSEVLNHLSEITGLPVEEIDQKITNG